VFFCCCKSCTIASDNFDRPDSSTVDGWTEVSGDWAIVDNGLKPPTGGLDDLIKFDTPDPGDADGIRWSTTFDFGAPENLPGEMKWIVDYVDVDNYHFAELVVAGASQLSLKLWKREGGSNTQLGSTVTANGVDFNTAHTLEVCWGFQGSVPACSDGTFTWVWTFDPTTETYFWQPRFATGDCQSYFCTSDPPGFDGELEDDEEQTTCYPNPAYGASEGDSVFSIAAVLDGVHSVRSSAVSLGGTHVGLSINNAPETFRFDNATLSRLKRGCPNCGAPAPECESGCGESLPGVWLVEFEGIANVATDPTVCNCNAANRSMLIPASVLPCHWQEYFGAPSWQYCPGSELEDVDGSHIWAGEVFIPHDKRVRLITRQPNVEAGNIGFGEIVATFEADIPEETNCDEVERLELFTEADLSEVLVDLGLLGEYEICDYTGWRVFLSAVA
jgi:hypothetical protein